MNIISEWNCIMIAISSWLVSIQSSIVHYRIVDMKLLSFWEGNYQSDKSKNILRICQHIYTSQYMYSCNTIPSAVVY